MAPLLTDCGSLNLLDAGSGGGGCVRNREIFLMDFSSVGLRRNLQKTTITTTKKSIILRYDITFNN